ncbi:MAG TPA: hypothetical protein VGE07_17125 [Herpetosiphonaceae bacterium]
MNERATGVAFCALALMAAIAEHLSGAVYVTADANLDVFALLLGVIGVGYLLAADGSRIFPPRSKDKDQ